MGQWESVGILVAWETQAALSQGRSAPIATAPACEVCSVLKLLEKPHCPNWVLRRGLLATPSSDFVRPYILWKGFEQRVSQ